MTLKQCIKKQGLQTEVSKFYLWSSVDIDFINFDGMDDETQFDVMFVDTRDETEKLAQLYKDFCRENKFSTNTVKSVTVVKSVPCYDEL